MSLDDLKQNLAGLSASKSSIKAATKVALLVPDEETVVKKILKHHYAAEDPLPSFFLMDSILKMALIKGQFGLSSHIRPHIEKLAMATVANASQKTINTVHKVIGYWVQRSIFENDIVQPTLDRLPAADPDSKKVLPNDKIFKQGEDGFYREDKQQDKLKEKKSSSSRNREASGSKRERIDDAEFAKIERQRKNKDYVNRFDRDMTERHADQFAALWGDGQRQ